MTDTKVIDLAADISTRPEFENVESPLILRIVQAALKALQPALSYDEAEQIACNAAKWRGINHEYTQAKDFKPHSWVVQAVADATMRYSPIRAYCNGCRLERPHHGDPENIHLHLCDACNGVVDY